MKKSIFLIIIGFFLLLLNNCADKDKFDTLGPSANEGTSLYQYNTKWGKDYHTYGGGIGPGYGDGTSSSDPGGFNQPEGIATSFENGKVYVYVSDTGNDRIQKFDDKGNIVFFSAKAGYINGNWLGKDDSGPSPGFDIGAFASPQGLIVKNGLFVADRLNSRFQKFNLESGAVEMLITSGSTNGFGVYTSITVKMYSNTFIQPNGIAVDSSDNIYVVDTKANKIFKFNSSGSNVREWGGLGSTTDKFNSPYDIVISSDDKIFISDTLNHRIQVFNTDGEYLYTIGKFGFLIENLYQPLGLGISRDDKIFVVDGNYIKIFDKTGNFITYIGGDTGKGNGEFKTPKDVAVDYYGNVYVADTGNNRIQKFSPISE